MSTNTIRYIASYLPRSWRIKLLEALAWPEFRVQRSWLVSDPSRASGLRVDWIPLDDTLAAEAEAMAALTTSTKDA